MAGQIKEGTKLTGPDQLAVWGVQANGTVCLWLLHCCRKPQGLQRSLPHRQNNLSISAAKPTDALITLWGLEE